MKSLWNEQEAESGKDELDLRVYTSRLLGKDDTLVLHGGGNTSLKVTEQNLLGDEEEILYVKGSGWDLATIERQGFAPVKMANMIRLAELKKLSDPEMVNQLKTNMTLASAPAPSVETILHAILPYKYVDHTHADAVVTITNTDGGEDRISKIYGNKVVVVPYVMPGFDLAKLAYEVFNRDKCEETIGMVLMNHGIFSFGDNAKQSYERMIDLVNMAESFLKAESAWELDENSTSNRMTDAKGLAELRRDISQLAGFPVIAKFHDDGCFGEFACLGGVADFASRGPATPDHVIRTKRLPLIGKDVASYGQQYEKYFKEHEDGETILDKAPRVAILEGEGIISIGKTVKDANIVADIYEHTTTIIRRAEKLSGWKPLPSSHIFQVEYWDLEQAKLKKAGSPKAFAGEVAIVTGAASGIGKACAEALLARGAAVVGLDLSPVVEHIFSGKPYIGMMCDITDDKMIIAAMQQTAKHFGGLDMLVLNAGIFPKSGKIAEMPTALWKKVMDVNLDANLSIMREAHELLCLAPRGGRVVIIGSKNVPAPGPGAAAYSASKAALTQLARVAALEWGGDNIRVNTIHPNMVFDTGIWTDEVLQNRAESYGLSVEEYKTNNVLKAEVSSRHVAEMAAEMCGTLFERTTGSQLPVDGGNDRVI